MKKLISTLICLSAVVGINAANADSMSMQTPTKMMYMDFGVGVGSASSWTQNSLALNAMTMGLYMNNNLAVEAGMDTLPDGANNSGQAMIMSYHFAAKGILPLSKTISLYGKAGLGVNSYEGEAPASDMVMDNQASAGLYYAGGVKFNFNQYLAAYIEGSGILVPVVGNNGNTASGSFGSTYQGTIGLEVSI